MRLYRPVGRLELERIAEAGFRAYPPRLFHQPIFYPVLDLDYARMIARDWNPTDEASGYVGFVTRFDVDDAFVARYEVKRVGARNHLELWVPAEELEEFNRHIVGLIETMEVYPGEAFAESIDEATSLPEALLPAWRDAQRDANGPGAIT